MTAPEGLEEDQDLHEIPLEIQGDDDKTLSERDSYDELAKDAEVATEPPKRGRGRPLGSKNKQKVPEPVAAPEGLPEESEPEPEPETPKAPKRRKARSSPTIPILDIEFDKGYGGAGPPKKPVRVKKPQTAARSLMEMIAQAAGQHGEREPNRRRTFYVNYLPL